jgi:hypothetical protein
LQICIFSKKNEKKYKILLLGKNPDPSQVIFFGVAFFELFLNKKEHDDLLFKNNLKKMKRVFFKRKKRFSFFPI